MSAKRSAVAQARAEAADAIQALDLRRQHQIQNQIEIINRISDQGGYDDAMQDLVERLTNTQVELDEAKAEISRLQAAQVEA